MDSVSEVLAIPDSDIEEAPSFGAKLRSDFISGMGNVNDKFVIILSIEQVLSIKEMVSLVDQMERSVNN